VAGAEAYLHAKFNLDPSNRLTTTHQRYRQDRQTDTQRSDSIGRTVLQTVAQKDEKEKATAVEQKLTGRSPTDGLIMMTTITVITARRHATVVYTV